MCAPQSRKVISKWYMINMLLLTLQLSNLLLSHSQTYVHDLSCHSFKFLWETANSKPPTIPYGIVACTFSDNLNLEIAVYIYIKRVTKVRLFLIGGPFSRPINRFPFPDSFQILQLMKHMKPVPCSGEPSRPSSTYGPVISPLLSISLSIFLKCCFLFCQLFCFVFFFFNSQIT